MIVEERRRSASLKMLSMDAAGATLEEEAKARRKAGEERLAEQRAKEERRATEAADATRDGGVVP